MFPTSDRYRETVSFSQRIVRLLIQLYDWIAFLPFANRVLLDVRHRVRLLQADDEQAIRLRTVKYVLLITAMFALIWALLLFTNRSWWVVMLWLCATTYLYSFFKDALIQRLEMRLLMQWAELLKQVRQRYHRHHMVLEALQEAAPFAGSLARVQVLRIAACLAEHDPKKALSNYYEIAPNKFLQLFAGMSYLVFEYGDRDGGAGGLYLRSLATLCAEVEMEVVRRKRLSYLLQSLQSLTLLPLLALSPLERWAGDSFPAMSNFYASGKGFLCEVLMYVIALLCFSLMRELQVLESQGAQSKHGTVRIYAPLANLPVCRAILARWLPARGSRNDDGLRRLLMRDGQNESVEVFYVRRLINGVVVFALSVTICLLFMQYEIRQVLVPLHDVNSFAPLNETERLQREAMHERDRLLLKRNLMAGDEQTVKRLTLKKQRLAEIRFRLWQMIACLFAAWLAYMMPLFLLMYRKGMRRMAFHREIEQFETLLTLLTPMEQMNVEQVLDWMLRFAHHFQMPLQKCLLHFAGGGWLALEQMKEEVDFLPFRRLVEPLQEATERIALSEAFDDLQTDRDYILEQRKLHFEKLIASKATIGKLIGFVPLYSVIVIYLLLPMMYVSMQQMQGYYAQFTTF